MIIMIHQSRVSGCRNSLSVASAVFFFSGIALAAVVGLTLGLVGAQLGDDLRGLMVTLAIVAIVGAAIGRGRPWQLNRDTALSWLFYNDWRTAALNGAELGVGVTTRVGYWLWYIVPLGAVASGSARNGALLYMSYATVRLAMSLSLAWLSLAHGELADAVRARLRRANPVYSLAFFFIAAFITVDQMQWAFGAR